MTTYTKVSTAEKRAEIETNNEEWPVCDCHDKPKKWMSNKSCRAGGFFTCAVRQLEAQKRYQKRRYASDPEFRAYHLEKGREWRETKWTPTYTSWVGMKQRCRDQNHRTWQYYGALGVTVCDRWIDSFENFLADMGERPEGMSLDRIDPFGNYEPSNCRWATPSEQTRNQRKKAASSN